MGLRMEESKRKPMGTLEKRNKALGLCRGSIGLMQGWELELAGVGDSFI